MPPGGGRQRLRLPEVVVAGRGLPFFPRATGAILRVAAACTTRVTVEGLENIPQSGPLLVICNHCSNADGMLLLAYIVPALGLSLIHISEPTRLGMISYAVFCLKKKKKE